jgi:hypothetical protein
MSNLLGKRVLIYDRLDTTRLGYRGKIVLINDEPKVRNMPQYGFDNCKYAKFDDENTMLNVMGRYYRGWPIYYKCSISGFLTKGMIRSINDDIVKVTKDNEHCSPVQHESSCTLRDIESILIADAAFDIVVDSN